MECPKCGAEMGFRWGTNEGVIDMLRTCRCELTKAETEELVNKWFHGEPEEEEP